MVYLKKPTGLRLLCGLNVGGRLIQPGTVRQQPSECISFGRGAYKSVETQDCVERQRYSRVATYHFCWSRKEDEDGNERWMKPELVISPLFSFKDLKADNLMDSTTSSRYFCICDGFPFFQCSFPAILRYYVVKTPKVKETKDIHTDI